MLDASSVLKRRTEIVLYRNLKQKQLLKTYLSLFFLFSLSLYLSFSLSLFLSVSLSLFLSFSLSLFLSFSLSLYLYFLYLSFFYWNYGDIVLTHVQCELLNVIALGQTQTGNINKMIIITKPSYNLISILSSIGTLLIWSHELIDNIHIPLSGFHSICKKI
jgi:hypothetical protein